MIVDIFASFRFREKAISILLWRRILMLWWLVCLFLPMPSIGGSSLVVLVWREFFFLNYEWMLIFVSNEMTMWVLPFILLIQRVTLIVLHSWNKPHWCRILEYIRWLLKTKNGFPNHQYRLLAALSQLSLLGIALYWRD